jgi:hypothetical protein
MRNKALALAVLLVTACAAGPGLGPSPDAQLITLQLMPGFMGNTSYDLKVDSDGRGRLEWQTNGYPWRQRHIANFKITAAQFEQFRQSLAAFRPQVSTIISNSDSAPGATFQIDHDRCGEMATDQANARITWRGRGPEAFLQYDFGCDEKQNSALVRVLRDAPKSILPPRLAALPIW